MNRDLSGYQVVRQEFVTSCDDVLITFNRGRFYINSYGLRQFPEKDYIQILVDEDTKSMVIKPSVNKKRDSFVWAGGMKKRKPRHIKCIPLFYLIFRMMNWDISARYQIRGNIEDYGEEEVIFVDFRDAICFIRSDSSAENGGREKYQMQMPAEWEKTFGMPVMEYAHRQDIKTFNDMAVFDVEIELNQRKKEKMEMLSEQKEAKEDEGHEKNE